MRPRPRADLAAQGSAAVTPSRRRAAPRGAAAMAPRSRPLARDSGAPHRPPTRFRADRRGARTEASDPRANPEHPARKFGASGPVRSDRVRPERTSEPARPAAAPRPARSEAGGSVDPSSRDGPRSPLPDSPRLHCKQPERRGKSPRSQRRAQHGPRPGGPCASRPCASRSLGPVECNISDIETPCSIIPSRRNDQR